MKLSKGKFRLATLLNTVRKKFYETGDPTYLAYAFYGNANLWITPSNVNAKKGNAQSSNRSYVVQVTSRASQTGVLAAFANMQQKYPNLMEAYAPDIQRADLGEKGILYRLRVGPFSTKTAAQELCSKLKTSGHPGCFVRDRY